MNAHWRERRLRSMRWNRDQGAIGLHDHLLRHRVGLVFGDRMGTGDQNDDRDEGRYPPNGPAKLHPKCCYFYVFAFHIGVTSVLVGHKWYSHRPDGSHGEQRIRIRDANDMPPGL